MNQEPIEFDKILRLKCKIEKENYFVEDIFLFAQKFLPKIYNCQYSMKYGEFQKSVLHRIVIYFVCKSQWKTILLEFAFGE